MTNLYLVSYWNQYFDGGAKPMCIFSTKQKAVEYIKKQPINSEIDEEYIIKMYELDKEISIKENKK